MEKQHLKLGIQPFWFWNGDMNEEEIIRQITEMKKQGIPGFLIHPRQGMEIPYMSKAFFDRVRLAVQTAKELDMEVWLYDEYPYPSGICGGEVILDHPEYLCKRLKRTASIAEGGTEVKLSAPWGRVVLARAYRMNGDSFSLDDYIDLQEYAGTGYAQEIFQYRGLTQYNKKRFFTGDARKVLNWTAPEGTWKIYLVTEVVMNHFKYFENYIDTLNPDAIKYFIELTHERYKREIGEEFGHTVKGVFSDEITAFPDSEPWSPLLPELVLKKYGLDLVHHLPALWEDIGDDSVKARYAYWSTATDSFIDAYDKQIYEWCEQNNLMYIGEKPIMRSKQLKYFHIPGIDSGHQKVGAVPNMIVGKNRANGKMVSSAAHFYDKPAALCEVGHSIGWGMTIQDLKWIFDWLAVIGIDWYIIHGFFFTTDGLKKHDAPPSAFYQMPWWKDVTCLTKYASDMSRFLQNTKRDVRILMLDPVTSTWTSDRDTKFFLRNAFGELQTQMMHHGLDYYIIDPELFAEGTVTNGHFNIHNEEYDMLVLPPMTNLEETATNKLIEYIKNGGRVCALSSIPHQHIIDNSAVGRLAELFDIDASYEWSLYRSGEKQTSKASANLYFAADTKDLVNHLNSHVNKKWIINPLDGLGMNQLPSMTGTGKAGEDVLFIVNSSSYKRTLEITNPKGITHTIELEAFASEIFTADIIQTKADVVINLDRELYFKAGKPNALRLGYWNTSFGDNESAYLETAPFIDQMETAKFSYPVTQKNYFGCPKELAFTGASMTYETDFLCRDISDKSTFLMVMEPSTLLGDWTININGHILKEEDFVTRDVYLPTNLTVNIGGYINDGINHIEVTVTSELSYCGLRNPLYIFGDFAVKKEKETWCLCPYDYKGRMESLK
ncbi:MAG: hypothetical protein J6B39_08850, partial [Lachnospiraceae bacterium]|nr:hypothetical protein [Lachnospiraceae bacterium]